MEDRELLELAAKAAGLDAWWSETFGFMLLRSDGNRKWSPLVNDGDAARLAAKLMMSVEISEYEQSTYAYAGKVPRVYACEMWRDDKYAATRRAIVRAAEEIGKQMA